MKKFILGLVIGGLISATGSVYAIAKNNTQSVSLSKSEKVQPVSKESLASEKRFKDIEKRLKKLEAKIK